ncbi:hypothetical protein [Kitasatospora sp. NPDC090091]|uniref:hypothetical protein n=1 Tax=Kitasatospora sp. NPDC090091 TaxID=3364081 RepID=UPI0037FDD258
MAQSYTGRPWPTDRPSGGRNWPWVLLAVVQLLVAAPLLTLMAFAGLAIGIGGLAAGGTTTGAVLLRLLLLATGPALGLLLPALALFSPAVRRVNSAALFALFCSGLLTGTVVEYFVWVRPAGG